MQIILSRINHISFSWHIDTQIPSHAVFTHIKSCRQARERSGMAALAEASLIRGLLWCRCAPCLVNLDQWELPAHSCAASAPLCLTRLQRWHQVNTFSHVWTHVRTPPARARACTRPRRAVFLNRIHLCSRSELHPARWAGACYMQSPCSRPEINR